MEATDLDLAVEFGQFAFPLVSVYPNERRILSGTTTIVTNNGSCYLVNAKHTFDTRDSRAFLTLYPPRGEVFIFSDELISKSIHSDLLDISITKMDYTPSYECFVGTRPVPLFADFPYDEYADFEERLLFFGYPSSRAKPDVARGKFIASPILYTSNEVYPPYDQKKYGKMEKFHIVSDFNGKKVKNPRLSQPICQAPALDGMSGGPIFKWHVQVGEEFDTPIGPLDFVGIATDKDKNKWLKGVKKECILELINSV